MLNLIIKIFVCVRTYLHKYSQIFYSSNVLSDLIFIPKCNITIFQTWTRSIVLNKLSVHVRVVRSHNIYLLIDSSVYCRLIHQIAFVKTSGVNSYLLYILMTGIHTVPCLCRYCLSMQYLWIQVYALSQVKGNIWQDP